MTLVLRYAARSDRGLVRGNNQDSVYAGPRLLAVADGMGGHAAGDVASKVVIAALEHLDDDAPSGDMLQALREAVFDGSEHLREVIRESPQLEGMGTTLTAVLFAGGRLALCHIGDSRAYLLRDGVLTQITHDDTFVQTLIDDGRITPEEANHHPQRSLLLRALNGQEVDPYLSMREARAGDRYLLCSDGLSGVVSEETLASALEDPDPQATADRLIELALRSGGPDNITVIVADVVEDGGHGTAPLDPVVDGAAGDNVGQRAVDPRSAAGRAALADPPPTPPAAPGAGMASAPPPGRRRRRLLWGLGALLLVLAVVAGAYVWVLSNWFVGVQDTASGERVTVFRGIDTALLGVDLNRVADVTDLGVDDLTQADASKVRRGIEANDGDHADRIVAMLRDQRLPTCPAEQADGGQTLSSSPTPAPAPAPDGGALPAPGEPTPPVVPAEPTSEATAAERSTPAPEPGVDCREAK
ncbi:PP2C family protein-serine/threonine phosphatase [Geodermatophilus sabuli]|uniref:Serine/threonine protein phosphatase PstP n=1 Tax=Geodermatophilus sabuli TaxID=1564158 RepID=A0A285EET4_9ACTN|nr:PP2C family serine/threonine-protein phosphatase [Geodermatophilus sabuli]MBB3086297.1 protein phosphatase [Geodermatophilus sabuli]SNX97487.1 protein phosphatase [Geodermatophilus sabuli]